MDHKLNLSLGQPIYLENVGYIYPPKVKDVMSMGEENYNYLLAPFLVSVEALVERGYVNEFDIIVLTQLQYEQEGQEEKGLPLLDILLKAISFFMKTENIEVEVVKDKLENNSQSVEIKIDNKSIINRDNYKEFEKIIMDINKVEKPKIEKPPEFKSERQRDIWEKLQKGRQRKKDKEHLDLASIINMIKFGGKTYISSEQILEMSIWEVYNAFGSIIEADNYDKNMAMLPVIISAGGKVDSNTKHISQSLKI